MNNGTSRKYRSPQEIFAVMGVIILLISLYLTGIINSGFKTVSPVGIIGCFWEKGFPFGTFLVVVFLCCLFVGFGYLKNLKSGVESDVLGRNFLRRTQSQAYGDTHFETPKEYKEVFAVQPPEKAVGTILGQLDDTGKKLINQRIDNTRDNRHMVVVGASGTGKSYTFSIPYAFQCARRRESIIITDPDGGLYRKLAGYFEDQGYVVRRFDLANLNKSDGWHCVKSVFGDNVNEVSLNSQLFTNTVISNITKDMDGNIYASGPMTLLKALIMRVVLGDDYPLEEKNIRSVYQLLVSSNGEADLDLKFGLADQPLVAGSDVAASKAPYQAFKNGSPNLRGNIITNLAVDLQLFQDDTVCSVLSTDDIDLELPGKQPCAYFCIFPDSHDTYKFIVSLFFSMLFIRLVALGDRSPGGRCPVPVNFLLDEFASIGKLPDFERKLATVRKRALNIVMIFQDITQLQNSYPTTWVTLMSNCATFLSLGVNDGETANLMTKRIGETTVQVETEQHQAVESIFKVYNPYSSGSGKRSLLSYEELFRVDKDSVIILAQRHGPIMARKYPYPLHPDASLCREIALDDIPDITDVEGRAARREAEAERVQRYLEEHPAEDVGRICSDWYDEYDREVDKSPIEKARDTLVERLEKSLATTSSVSGKNRSNKNNARPANTDAEKIHNGQQENAHEGVLLVALEEENFVPSVAPVREDVNAETTEIVLLPDNATQEQMRTDEKAVQPENLRSDVVPQTLVQSKPLDSKEEEKKDEPPEAREQEKPAKETVARQDPETVAQTKTNVDGLNSARSNAMSSQKTHVNGSLPPAESSKRNQNEIPDMSMSALNMAMNESQKEKRSQHKQDPYIPNIPKTTSMSAPKSRRGASTQSENVTLPSPAMRHPQQTKPSAKKTTGGLGGLPPGKRGKK